MSKNTNLSFLTDYITADITNGRIGINNASPTVAFDVVGVAKFSSTVTATGIINANAQASASNGSINIESADPTLRFRVTGGTANKRIYEWRAIAGGTIYDYLQLRLWNDAQSSSSELLAITSAGNVGIGINPTATDYKLSIYGSNSRMTFQNVDTGTTDGDGFFIGNYGINAYVYNYENAPILFGANATERMRITAGGELYWNITAITVAGLSTGGIAFRNNGSKYLQISTGVTSDQAFIYFYKSDGAGGVTNTGSISSSGSTTLYNVTSDYRLKEDLKPINGLEKVSLIKVYDYKWKSDNSRMDGVLAHELQEVLPYAVTGKKDGEDMQSVDYSKLVPVLVKAIQELKAEIEILKTNK